MASLNFDATTVAPQDSFSPIPAGDYIAQVTESSIKPTKSGTGMILNLTWTVLSGQFANRKVFDRINIQNQNPEAEKIGQRQLSAVCHAAGVLKLQDSNQLHGRPCTITVKIRKDEQWGDSNEVKGYAQASGQPAAAPSFAPAAQPAAAGSAGATPPWAKAAA
jgi:hypothetical protein